MFLDALGVMLFDMGGQLSGWLFIESIAHTPLFFAFESASQAFDVCAVIYTYELGVWWRGAGG